MSKKTFIPKWKPGYSLGNNSGFISESKFRRQPSRFDGIENTMTIRTIHEGRRNGFEAAPWITVNNNNFSQPNDCELTGTVGDNNRNINKLTKGRVTQRVGMFRNAKQSQVIYNNVSSAVRKMVDRDIEELIAPECDVQWAPNINNPCNNINNNSKGIDNNNNCNNFNSKNVEMNEREDGLFYDHQTGARRSRAREDFPLNECALNVQAKRVRYCDQIRNNDLSSCNGPAIIRKQSEICTPSHTPYNEELIDPVADNENEKNEKLPYPSIALSKRMLATLPALGLRDDDRKDYDTVALSMMTESIRRSVISVTSETNMLESFMNKTQAINISSAESLDSLNDVDANQHEFLIPPSPFINGVRSSSPPPTPPLEKEFNQTIIHLPFNNDPSDHMSAHLSSKGLEDEQENTHFVNIEGGDAEILYAYEVEDGDEIVESHFATEGVTRFWPFDEEESCHETDQEPSEAVYNWTNAWQEKSSYF